MGIDRLAARSYKHAGWALVLWLTLVIGFGYYALQLPDELRSHGLTPTGSYEEVNRIISEQFHLPVDPMIIVITAKSSASEAEFAHAVQETVSKLQGAPGLKQIMLTSGSSKRQGEVYVLLEFALAPYEQLHMVDEVRSRLPQLAHVDIKLTGKQVVQADVNAASRRDLTRAELMGIPIAALLMWIAFRGITTAVLPIISGLASVITAMGITTLAGRHLELSNFVLNVIPMVGLALSIDFALLIVSRFREELNVHSDGQALLVTMRTAGKAVLWSAACVLCGLAGVLFIPLPMFASIAIASITVLLISLIAAYTLVPALMAVLLPYIRAPGDDSSNRTSLWHSWSAFVMKRPFLIGILSAVLLLVGLSPLDRLRLEVPDATSLPQAAESRLAYERWLEGSGLREQSLIYVVLGGEHEPLSKQHLMEAYQIERQLRGDPEVMQVQSIFSLAGMDGEQLYRMLEKPEYQDRYQRILQRSISGSYMLYEVTLRGRPNDRQVHEWLRRWEQRGVRAELPFQLGGEAKYVQEVHDTIFRHIPYTIAFIILINYVILFAAFRSLLIPLKTIFMNLLSLGASYGIITWICQDGRFGIEPGGIAIMIPVFIFGLVFGISMDYGVFLVSRIYEAYRAAGNNDLAVRHGMVSSGRVITLAAAIMIAVTLPFSLADVAGVKQLGIGIAAALFIAATVIRMGLVPVLMKLFGRWNWWSPV